MTPGDTSVNLGHGLVLGLVLVRSLRLWNASVSSLGPQPRSPAVQRERLLPPGRSHWEHLLASALGSPALPEHPRVPGLGPGTALGPGETAQPLPQGAGTGRDEHTPCGGHWVVGGFGRRLSGQACFEWALRFYL